MQSFSLSPEIGTTDCSDFKALGTRVQLTRWVSAQGNDHHPELSESVSSVSSVVLPIAVSRFRSSEAPRGGRSGLG